MNILHTDQSKKIKKLKLYLAWLVILIIAGLFYWLSTIDFTPLSYFKFLNYIPFEAIAGACITTIMISFVYEAWIRKETLNEIQNTPFSPEIVKKVITSTNLDLLLRTGLQRILRDDTFGNDLYDFISASAIFNHERRFSSNTILTLLPLDKSFSEDHRIHFYELIIDIEYWKVLTKRSLLFICVDNPYDYNRKYEDFSVEWKWLTPRMRLYPNFDRNFYTLHDFSIDDEVIPIKTKESISDDLEYKVNVPSKFIGKERRKINYRVRLKVQRFGHTINLDIREPTKGIRYTFDFSKTDIMHVNPFSSSSSPDYPRIQYYPDNNSFHRIDVAVDGWCIPQSGVSFSWVLRLEDNLEIRKRSIE